LRFRSIFGRGVVVAGCGFVGVASALGLGMR
jgi:hypothetical protein